MSELDSSRGPTIGTRFQRARRASALWLSHRFQRLALWLDLHTAPQYDPSQWQECLLTQEEYEAFMKGIGRDDE